MIPLHYNRGVHLTGAGLWLDPADPKAFAFVSHAHSDHTAPHQEVILSEGTARLMNERMGGVRREHILEFNVPRAFDSFQITLLPAGHIFGSAQSFIESNGEALLYTGDFKLRPGLSSEPAQWCHTDTLIMETTYGLPRYVMPPTEEVLEDLVGFCHDALHDGDVPVLLGYSLGKSQEILCALSSAGLTPMLHSSVYKMTEVYRQLRPDFPCNYERYQASEIAGKVLVCPPSTSRSQMITRIKNRRTAVVTGWALDPGARFRYQCDAAFPLSDHADYPDLIRYVELVQPKRVLTLHGFASAFAADLRERGFEAWALTQENQLELLLKGVRRPTRRPTIRNQSAATDSPFYQFAALGEKIAGTSSKLKKIGLLAEFLRSLEPGYLASAVNWMSGRAFSPSDGRTLQVGWAVIRSALLATTELDETQFRATSRHHSDASKTTYEVLLGVSNHQSLTLPDAAAIFETLHQARGPLAKSEILQHWFSRLTPLESSYLVKILTGDLRIGLKEGLVLDAISAAFEAEPHEVRETQMLTGDLGQTAALAASKTLHTSAIQLFRPIQCMLASPEIDASSLWKRIEAGRQPFWAEDKYDGIRAQLHIDCGNVEIFTRDLKKVTSQFTDLAHAAAATSDSLMLDGEILAFHEGHPLSFFDLQRRLGRKQEHDFFLDSSDIPVVFRVFDLLYLNGQTLLKRPLSERRKTLETLSLPAALQIAPRYPVDSEAAIEALFIEARARGNEGLILKDSESYYTPGRRGLSWLKLKKELATLDVVVIGAETGHGRRAQVLSDYTFAVREKNSGLLRTIGKAYSGLTDQEIEDLTRHFKSSTISIHGNYHVVHPQIVLEIAFDSIQPSTRHNSGLALRFPRIKSIRHDKSPDQIDTLEFARTLATGVKQT